MSTGGYKPAPSRALLQTVFYSVEYPGFVSSNSEALSRAIETLGGQTAVDQVFRQPRAKVLELKLRPNDLFAHPIPGEAVSTLKIVTKVTTRRRRRKNQAPHDVQGTEEPWQDDSAYVVDALGVIPRTVRFRAMADFQFQPEPSDPITQLRETIEKLDDSTVQAIMGFKFPVEKEDYSLPLEEERPSETQPDPDFPKTSSNLRIPGFPMFSRATVPAQYNYKANPFSTLEKVRNPETGQEYERLINRTRFKGFGAVAIDFDHTGPVPDSLPPQMAATTPGVSAAIMQRLSELFEERPMWTRVALLNQFPMAERRDIFNSKTTLPLVSYAFNDGPFRDLHIRFGYDPRKDSASRIYQRVTYRSNRGEMRRKPVLGSRDPSSIKLSVYETPYIFDSQNVEQDLAPGYQLCDIKDALLEKLINAADLRTECHYADGWYSAEAFARIKLAMRRKLLGISEQGRIITDEEALAAPTAKETDAGEGRTAKPSVKKETKRKRNVAKGVRPWEEDAAARLKEKLKKQEVEAADSDDGSQWEDDDGDSDFRG